MKLFSLFSSLPLLACLARAQIDLDVNDPASLKAAAAIAAKNSRALYPDKESWFVQGEFGLIGGNQNNGYYWWEAGAWFGSLVYYWAYTGDMTYNDLVLSVLPSKNQTGDDENYEPPKENLSLGNDDQSFWGIAAMAAAERGFPNPPSGTAQWLALAQAVFNRQWGRWESDTCGGGLRWQINPTNQGYDYKNTISNGLLFYLGAHLAHYTGNSTYADVSETIYKWIKDTGLISSTYQIYDGAQIPTSNPTTCKPSSLEQWTYSSGVLISGASYLYSFYNDTSKKEQWKTETTSLLNATTVFFNSDSKYFINALQEPSCEYALSGLPSCNTDQRSFKSYLVRFLGEAYQVADFTRDYIKAKLQASAQAAAKSCSGTVTGTANVCGLSWRKAAYDGAPYGIALGGLGEQMAAMEVFQNNLLFFGGNGTTGPVTQNNGGTSQGNPNAGAVSDKPIDLGTADDPATTAGRAGAAILTIIMLSMLLGVSYFVVTD